ncbi:hypothetical protein BY996DRAFT_6432139 [Phakopsora pachyrhizi]|nr:hypothetical protein BY996DRAFT_6432139 [Phakopsora pachyrhizi]
MSSIMNQKFQNCSSFFGQMMAQDYRFVNFKPVLLPLVISFAMLWSSAVSLPEPGYFPICFRLAMVPILLTLAFDIGTNKSYSLGSPLRDVIFSYWACLIVFRILDMAVVSLWDESPAPKWIKPRKKILKSAPSEGLEGDMKSSNEKEVNTATPTNRESVQYLWTTVPHPPLLSFERALYGLDVVLLNRPGTPWLFPWRLRSLDWSLPALNRQRKKELNFGQPEWPFLIALAHYYIRNLDLDGKREGARNLWQINLKDQILVTFALGAIIAFGTSLEEAIVFPLLIKTKILPPTALLGQSRRAILSDGLVELWGYRWHHNWRRSFVRTARLFPAGMTAPGNAIWSFFLSGTMHSIMFSRVYPIPRLSNPCTLIPILWEPGIMFFFISQGIGTVIEKYLFPNVKTKPNLLRRFWMYAVLIGTGRHLVNSMIIKGWLSAYEWNQLNYGNVLSDFFGWRLFA